MSYKTLPLSEQEVDECEINPLLLKFLDKKAKDGIPKDKIRILDWGCGRGRKVAKLKKLGYDAFGVELDQDLIENVRNSFKVIGINSQCISEVSVENKTTFPNEYFDLIFTEHVVEHIRDITAFATEHFRILKKGSLGIHTFPAKYNLKEVHLFMPFLHWLPKNKLRKFLISIYVKLGIEPKWQGVKDKVNTYYNYSIQKTYYRSLPALRNLFKNHGLKMDYATLDNSKFYRLANRLNINNSFGRKLLFNALIRFRIVHLYLQKQ